MDRAFSVVVMLRRPSSLLICCCLLLPFLLFPVAAQQLRPIPNRRRNLADSSLLAREEEDFSSSFDLRSSEIFLWGEYDHSSAVLGNLTVHMPEDYENIVSVERFAPLIKSLVCDERGMTMAFKDDLTFARAKAIWDWVNGADDNSFVMVAGPGDCGWNEERQPYMVRSLEYDEEKDTARLIGEPAGWEGFARSYDLVVGQVAVSQGSLVKRDDSKTVSIPFKSRFPFIIEVKERKDLNVKMECLDCGTNGRLDVELRMSARAGGLTEASIAMSPSGVDVLAFLEFNLYSEKTGKGKPIETKPLKIPVPASVNIPGVVDLGPSVDVLAGLAFSELKSQSVVSGGAKVAISDDSFVRLNLLNTSDSEMSGWALDVKPYRFSVDRRITAQLEAYLSAEVKLKAVVFGLGYDVGLNLKLPYLNGKFEPLFSPGGVCATQDVFGVQASINVGASLAIEAVEIATKKKLRDIKLGTIDFPLKEACWTFPSSFNGDGPPPVPQHPELPTHLPRPLPASVPTLGGPVLDLDAPAQCKFDDGAVGECIASTLCLVAGGNFETGRCNHIANTECCIKPMAQFPVPNPPLPVSCAVGSGESGVCISVGACASRGSKSASGYCPGPTDIQCCYEPTKTGSILPAATHITCGTQPHPISDVVQAKKAGCNHLSGQTTAGGSDYPRVFDDAESFELLGSPPWYEYPLVESQVYSGGAPGSDRVIFDRNCDYAGSVTIAGASDDQYVGCSDTDASSASNRDDSGTDEDEDEDEDEDADADADADADD